MKTDRSSVAHRGAFSVLAALGCALLLISGCTLGYVNTSPDEIPAVSRSEVIDSVIDFEDFSSVNGTGGTLGLYSYGLSLPAYPAASGDSSDSSLASCTGAGADGSGRYAVLEGSGEIDLTVPSVVDSIRIACTKAAAESSGSSLAVDFTGYSESGLKTGTLTESLLDASGGVRVDDWANGNDLNAVQWYCAKRALSALDGVIPYGITVGNHDYDDESDPTAGSSNFITNFGPGHYTGYSWWGGSSTRGLSSYQRFSMGNRSFIYLHLEVDSPGDTKSWAQGVMRANPDTPTLITTHAFLRSNGSIINVPYLSWNNSSWIGISAQEIFDDVIAPNDNVFMLTCGHISEENMSREANNAGNPVYLLLQDYQNRDEGGGGCLRLLRFYPAKDAVHVVTYSPYLGTCETDDDSDFLLPLDFSSRLSW